jgi:alpha-galactosidase
MARGALALLVVSALSGCSSEGPPSQDAGGSACTPGPTADGTVLAIGDECLTLRSVRARTGGAWQAVPAADVTVTTLDASTVTIGARARAAEAFEVTLGGARGAAIVQQGYQSWGFAGAVKVPASVPLGDDGALEGKAASTGSPLDEIAGVSYGAGLVGDPGGGGLAVASTSSAVASTAIAATRAEGASATTITVVYGVAREPLPADASGLVTMPPVVLAASAHANDALARAAERIRAGLGASTHAGHRPPGGWFSWNELFADVDEKGVRANLDVVAQKLAPRGMTLVEIDDGWEGPWGDWTANAKFPSGMDGVAKAMTDRDLVPGVWLAPFLVDTTSEAAKHTDASLFVRDAHGQPLRHQPDGSQHQYFVLDGTNPAAMEVVAKPIRDLRTAGYRFFKLDYLYAGALHGARKDAAATGVEALRRGLATLRAAMGEDAVFNACGAPIFPVLGLPDSLRVGTDTAYAAVSLAWADVAFAARSLAARGFLWSMVAPDADQAQLRAPYTLAEGKAAAAVAAMAGPAYSLGDDLTKLPADRLDAALAPELIDLAGAAAPALPDDPLEGPVDAVVVAPLVDTITSGGGTGAPPPTHFTGTGKSGTVYHLSFDWGDGRSVAITQ